MFEFGRPSHIFDLDKIHDAARGALGARGRDAEAAERQHRRARREGRRDRRRRRRSSRSPASWAATPRRCRDDTRNVYVEAAFWWPEAVPGRSRRFNFSTDAGHRFERGVDPALTVEHIERITAADHRHLRRRGRADGRPDAQPAAAQAGDAARGARGQGDRHAGHAGAVRRRLHAPGPAVHSERDGQLDRHAAELALRPADRGRPDRGSDPRHRLRQAAAHAAAGAGDGARASPKRGAALHALRHALAALDYQETINFSFVEARWEQRARRQRRPDPGAQPDRQRRWR